MHIHINLLNDNDIYLLYASIDICIRFDYLFQVEYGSGIHYNGGAIEFFRLKLCFPFSRCFGAKISKFELRHCHGMTDTQKYHLDRYANQYCAETLTWLIIWNSRASLMESFPQPFKSVRRAVRKVEIFAELRSQLPNLRELRVRMQQTTVDENTAAVYFPHLEHLALRIDNVREYYFSTKNAVSLLQANRQLQSLNIEIVQRNDTRCNIEYD